ncbi:MAG: hypothetical protein WBD40_16730, partial [Tepidisphaeraceae bacterium]
DVTFVVYQPQIEKWADNRLEARAAIAVAQGEGGQGAPAGQGAKDEKPKQSFGVVWLAARTEVDKANRIVSLEDVAVTKLSFPQDAKREPEYLAMIRSHVGDATREIPLDHLEANLAASQQERAAAAVPVKNDPPKVIFSKSPALLVLIDGEPTLRAIEGAGKLMRIVNTRALILFDANKYYLHLMNRWVESSAATGPWKPAASVPAQFEQVKQSLAKANAVDLLDPANAEAAPKELPTVYVSTTPAELIQTRGEPEYTPIAGTNLLNAKNTDSALFMDTASQQSYVLISGRWFKAPSVNGPWAYVAGKDLPPDFAKIPPDSPKANVLVSVPGTAEAKEAVIANSIPQTATVTIADAHLAVAYDGAPKFHDIDGAKGLSYALNTALPVIRIDAEKVYFCVSNGVWFFASHPTGPWMVATNVPGIIYTIPVSSPIHYVTYVRIYGSTPQVVYVGYTPGYMGTCVSSDGVVVYGTGYYYPAYVGAVWVGYPPTYGYGAGFAGGFATGFAFGFAAGAIIGDMWCQPYWGPCRGYGHVDINTSSVYRNWHGGVTYTNRHYEYDGYTGKSASSGRAATFNPYSGRASVGGYSNYIDRADGDIDLKRGGATYNPRTGTVTGGGRQISGNVYDGNVDVDKGGFKYNTRTDSGVAYKDGDVYAGHDGTVYRHTDDGDWQKHTDDGWQDTQRQGQSLSGEQRAQLDQQRSSRNLGQQRFEGTRSAGGYRGGGGGGRAVGGGGRGRR